MPGHVACMEMRNLYKILVGKPEEKTSFGRPRHKWEGSIKMDLKQTGYKSVDWTGFNWFRIGSCG
jgi:hypothetical protein